MGDSNNHGMEFYKKNKLENHLNKDNELEPSAKKIKFGPDYLIQEIKVERDCDDDSAVHYRSQSFTSLMADLREDINRVSSFSKCHNGTFT